MTSLLEKAFKQAAKLPDLEQNIIAKQLLEELSAEKKWDKTFAESEDVLSKLADEALEDHKKGRTTPL
ncbi:MAG: hypothetical protein ACUZ8E_14230 [Candidatus Anammoxibacter sp.]